MASDRCHCCFLRNLKYPVMSLWVCNSALTVWALEVIGHSSPGLEQGLATFFCKQPSGKYFRPNSHVVSVITTKFCLYGVNATSIDNMQTNGVMVAMIWMHVTSKIQWGLFRKWCLWELYPHKCSRTFIKGAWESRFALFTLLPCEDTVFFPSRGCSNELPSWNWKLSPHQTLILLVP